jgi:ABC-type multidrug transport system permease subunit
MLLSTLLTSAAQLQAAAPVLAMMTGFVGGCFWNWVEMPEGIARLSLLTPQGWALKGINSMMTGAFNAREVLVPILMLLAVTLILLPISYIIIKHRVTGS